MIMHIILYFRHILVEDCCFCPNCKFPANASYLRKILESENACPMCNTALDLNDVSLVIFYLFGKY